MGSRLRLRAALAAALLAAWLPFDAAAWWNADWPYRKQISVGTDPAAAAAAGATEVLVPIRLHAGNFPFVDAQAAGGDLRFVAADDKTPLDFHLEQFDSAEGLAIAWVRMPRIAGPEASIRLYFGHPEAPAAESSKATYDAHMVLALHFGEAEGLPRDATGYGNAVAEAAGRVRAAGAIGFGRALEPADRVRIAAAPSLATPPGVGWTVSMWLRPGEGAANGALLTRDDGGQRLQFALESGRPVLRVGDPRQPAQLTADRALEGGTWHHVAFTLGRTARVYVDGTLAAEGALALPDLRTDLVIGAPVNTGASPAAARGAATAAAGVAGEIDEFQVSNVERGPEWLRASALAQHPQSSLLEYGADEAGGGSDYLAIVRTLAAAVSVDGWFIIALIGVIGLVMGEVVLTKALALGRAVRQNREFLINYRDAASPLARMQGDAVEASARAWPDSPLCRLYGAAHRELGVVQASQPAAASGLTPQAMEVLRAGLDAEIVGQVNRLNGRMVLLTMAVAGAPFLGLLGTVVGIMITFGAIAMAGDVNVNTIAPGVAAALSTTVAGLIVAIPAMYGYNLLATRIREVTAGMEVFANELLGRLALQSMSAPRATAEH
jgi:biopolymer transport protein ExbB